MPRLSWYQPGLVEPNPALADQLAVFTGIGLGAAAADPAMARINACATSSSANARRRLVEPRGVRTELSLRVNIGPPDGWFVWVVVPGSC
jgi:hypothetical protein